ncbi:MAG: glycosyltransferase family 2 protein [Candidatus Binataceae bacterium]
MTDIVRVSIIIPVYNGAATVGAAIDSAFAQDFDGHEIIVVNDGSTDSTAEVIARYGARIHTIRQENRGPASARNAAAAIAGGEYLAFLDADDRWLPIYLSSLVAALDRNTNAAMAFCDLVPVQESGEEMRPTSHSGAPSLRDLSNGRWKIIPSAVVMRGDIFRRCGGFREEFRRPGGEDHYMWLLARECGKFEYVPVPLVLYHETPASELAEKYEEGHHIWVRLIRARYGRRARALVRTANGYRAALFVARATHQLDHAEPCAALASMLRSICAQPSYALRPAILKRLLHRKNVRRMIVSLGKGVRRVRNIASSRANSPNDAKLEA